MPDVPEVLPPSDLVIDAAFVEQQLSSIARNADLSRYVL